MSTYYQYQDVKLAIREELLNRGWKIYGYHEDRSDLMTDYYCPASWDGIAEKNGYILCVDISSAAEAYEIKKYTNLNAVDPNLYDKISKLEAMTVENGATEGEEVSAKLRLKAIQEKLNEQTEMSKEYTVVDVVPAHMENPPRCNWHLEKDGNYILKGNGILKYSSLYDDYYHYPKWKDSINLYMESPDIWRKKTEEGIKINKYYNTDEEIKVCLTRAENDIKNTITILEDFKKLISKIDSAAGCMIGQEDETVIYEKKTVTEYKNEIKAVETTEGEIKDGQCFILKCNFNYGHNKGQIFRIHTTELNGKTSYYAYKLNRKLTKECTGLTDCSNYWNTFGDKFNMWITKGYISFCELKEVKKPYEVEKVVKKVIKNEVTKEAPNNSIKENDNSMYTYDIKQDVDTRDNSTIWIVRVLETLDKTAYIALNKHMKELGAYYSKFKHGFLFRADPREVLTNGGIKI